MSFTDLVLGESLDVVIDNRGKNPPFCAQGVPVVSGMSVGNGRLDLSVAKHVSVETWARWGPTAIQRNDVVLTSEAPLGRVALVATDEPLTLGQRVFGLRGRQGILDSRFLYYALQTAAVQSDLQGRATGTTVVGIRQPALLKVRIPAPSYPDQRAIAEALGALDDKIVANSELAFCADELAGLVFDHAIEGAPLQTMSLTLKPVLGGTPARAQSDNWGGDRLWASAKDITGASFGVVIATQECITDQAASQTRAKPLPKGSVILTARGTVGAVARLGSPSSLNQSCYGFVPDVFPPGVLYFSILRATDRAKAFAHGSVFDTITMRTFDHLQVVDMPESELERVEARVGPLLARVEQAVRENESLAAMRDSLLPALMSGKIRVQDAEQMVGDVV